MCDFAEGWTGHPAKEAAEKVEEQIPRRLKPPGDDKNKRLKRWPFGFAQGRL
jgi:hypothetical protein